MQSDNHIDLYEIIINVELDEVSARLEKYWVKQTSLNFLPQTTDEDGYSRRLWHRVPVDELMRVRRTDSGVTDHASCSIYCLEHQQAAALALVKKALHENIVRRRDMAVKLHEVWTKDPLFELKERHADHE